ncbi:hypothetical protein B0H65DRAFT_467497 [Neurospora tetraspora]|uniref:Uncharacterized protein n=1 Tax=Neurospora tetraspora TaxID=94610 RepID=A0AAE0JGV5_9PEZI|nr:hypothetical protein B0H65DRAFT_467497 [Neurospora tetraspora]
MLTKFVHHEQVEGLEDQVRDFQQYTRDAAQEAVEHYLRHRQIPDAASIMKAIGKRVATAALSSKATVSQFSQHEHPSAPRSMGNETVQRAQAQWQAGQAEAQYEATRAGAFGTNTATFPAYSAAGAGYIGPPRPPKPPRHAEGLFDDRERADNFLRSMSNFAKSSLLMPSIRSVTISSSVFRTNSDG